MQTSHTNPPDATDDELSRLAAMPDDEIDTSDIPEIKDWSGAERGRFYRARAMHYVPLYLDREIFDFLTQPARARGIEPRDLANEMLKKDIELIRSIESG